MLLTVVCSQQCPNTVSELYHTLNFQARSLCTYARMDDIPPALKEATADGDVLLTFESAAPLQAHAAILVLWSTVLRHAIQAGGKRDAEGRLVIPTGDKRQAWVWALPFFYPPAGDGAPPAVTPESAADLAVLAHK